MTNVYIHGKFNLNILPIFLNFILIKIQYVLVFLYILIKIQYVLVFICILIKIQYVLVFLYILIKILLVFYPN